MFPQLPSRHEVVQSGDESTQMPVKPARMIRTDLASARKEMADPGSPRALLFGETGDIIRGSAGLQGDE